MARVLAPLSVIGLILLLSACGRSPSSAPSASKTPRTSSRTPAPAQSPSAAVAPKEEAIRPPAGPEQGYDAKGRRDPFEVPGAREGSAGMTVASAKLTGIMRSTDGTTLALVETPEGLGYILKRGDMLGDGQLIEIDQSSVVFSITTRAGPTGRVVLKLSGD
jgi:Tfp pilus assembly protein PilP